jgi:ferric-dicitrate binding protein FerR (iron transport regulator)
MDTSYKNRIRKYFESSSSDDESFVAGQYLIDSNEEELKEIAREHFDNASSSNVELQHILNSIHFHINTTTSKPSALTSILTLYYRIAAILLVPVLLGGIYFIQQNTTKERTYAEIMAPRGSRIQFTLPDGSTGYLNGGSRLQYSGNFSTNRKVNLNGEGYFEVVKDKRHPFIVQTKFADVKVYGTKFDVCAYESDPEFFTTLEEGSVSVFNKTQKKSALLVPGEQSVINTSNGNMTNAKVDAQLFTSWKDEILRFNNSPFNEVVTKMERWYGVKIMLDKSLRYSENYTFTVKTESLREVLQLLSITTPMSFKIENDLVSIYPLDKK